MQNINWSKEVYSTDIEMSLFVEHLTKGNKEQTKEEPTAQLVDDGTLDTVISVEGKEYRFNYSAEMEDTTLGEGLDYKEWIEQCKEDALNQFAEEN